MCSYNTEIQSGVGVPAKVRAWTLQASVGSMSMFVSIARVSIRSSSH